MWRGRCIGEAAKHGLVRHGGREGVIHVMEQHLLLGAAERHPGVILRRRELPLQLLVVLPQEAATA